MVGSATESGTFTLFCTDFPVRRHVYWYPRTDPLPYETETAGRGFGPVGPQDVRPGKTSWPCSFVVKETSGSKVPSTTGGGQMKDFSVSRWIHLLSLFPPFLPLFLPSFLSPINFFMFLRYLSVGGLSPIINYKYQVIYHWSYPNIFIIRKVVFSN